MNELAEAIVLSGKPRVLFMEDELKELVREMETEEMLKVAEKLERWIAQLRFAAKHGPATLTGLRN